MTKTTKKFAVGTLSAAMAITMLPMTPAMAKTAKTAKIPAQVKILTPKLVHKTHVQVRWNKAKNASKYRVYYRVGSGKWASANVSGKTTAYTTKSLGYSKVVSVKVAGFSGSRKGKASATKVIKTAAKGGSSAGKISTGKTAASFLYTADGKKVYVGKTYDTSYWGDTDSHRTIKVTYIPKIKVYKGGLYAGGDYLVGIDVKNGGVYSCAVCTKKNTNYKKFTRGIVCDNIEYEATAKLRTSGDRKGDAAPEDVTKLESGAISWLDNGWQAKQLTILKSDVTVVETIDGTEPTLNHYHSKWTKASTNGASFSTYQWGMGEAADGTVWSRATRWVRVYQGNKLIVDSIYHLYSWDE